MQPPDECPHTRLSNHQLSNNTGCEMGGKDEIKLVSTTAESSLKECERPFDIEGKAHCVRLGRRVDGK